MDKPDVTIPDGPPSYQLELDDLVVGEGDEAAAGNVVEVHYVGVSWSNGRQFDASWDRGDTFKFGLGKGQVIPGWDQGVAGMKVGGRRRIRASRSRAAAAKVAWTSWSAAASALSAGRSGPRRRRASRRGRSRRPLRACRRPCPAGS